MAHWWSQSAPDRARQLATGDLPFRAVGPDQSVLGVFHIGNLIAQLHHIAPVVATTDVGRAFQTVIDSLSVQEEMHRHLRHQLREIALQQGIESRQLRFRIMSDETYRRLRTRRTRRRLAAEAAAAAAGPRTAAAAEAPAGPAPAEAAAAAGAPAIAGEAAGADSAMDVSGAEQGAEREVPAPAEAQLQALYALPLGEATLEPGSPRPSEAPSEFRYPRRSLPTPYTDAEDTASEVSQFNELREPLPRVKPRAIRLSRHLRPASAAVQHAAVLLEGRMAFAQDYVHIRFDPQARYEFQDPPLGPAFNGPPFTMPKLEQDVQNFLLHLGARASSLVRVFLQQRLHARAGRSIYAR